MYDVIIIGAGVSGCAAARELSRFHLNICVVEKEEDVCCGTSKANSGIVHAGFDALPGSLMAKLNVLGNEMMEPLSRELNVPFHRNGSLVLCFSPTDVPRLEELYNRGVQNGVSGLCILSADEARTLEPGISDDVYAALYAPTGGIVCPFELTIALAENAAENGVEFRFNSRVADVRKLDSDIPAFAVVTETETLYTRVVVNAAGVYADTIHNLVSRQHIKITPRKGEYCLFDKTATGGISHTLFALPGQHGKGVLVTPTVHGNLLIGPTADDIEDREGTDTTLDGLHRVMEKASQSVNALPTGQIITSFAGLRAHEKGHEFLIQELPDVPGFVDCAGIESPGLSSAPAIGRLIADIVTAKLRPEPNAKFVSHRKGILNPSLLSTEERNTLIREVPAYGNIICRCEKISEGEILDAIHRPLGARSLDGIKRRVRAGMGRCQGGFCTPKVMEILAREWEIPFSDITKSGPGSSVICPEKTFPDRKEERHGNV